ncbi:MAG: ABC transporter permease [Fimbriimonadaceae bacterium]|nr:ABC transporter permease [Fimbriimonadaceae bacterium]
MSEQAIPHLTIRKKSGWQALPIRELWEFRDLLNTLAFRDVKLRYRQTAVGVIWVVLQPLIGAGLFSFIFGSVAKLSTGSDKVPYFAFSFAGLMVWNVFAQILQKSSDSMVGNAHLVSKIYFPRMILPLSTVYGVLLDFCVSSILLVVLLVLFKIPLTASIFFLPVAMLMAVMMALGVGLWAAALNVTFRDVKFVIPVFINFLMWGTPVAYAVASLPARAQAVIAYNPMTGVVESFRWAVLGTPIQHWNSVIFSALASILLFIWGAMMFQRAERKFADVI